MVIRINSLLRINPDGTLRVPHIFSAFHAPKMVVHPCTMNEGLINQTFLPVIPINSLLRIDPDGTLRVPDEGRSEPQESKLSLGKHRMSAGVLASTAGLRYPRYGPQAAAEHPHESETQLSRTSQCHRCR